MRCLLTPTRKHQGRMVVIRERSKFVDPFQWLSRFRSLNI